MSENPPDDVTDTDVCPKAQASVPMIDVSKALDLLAAVVRNQGEDFVYRPVSVAKFPSCRYARGGAPECLIGRALALAEVGVHDLEAMGEDDLRELYFRDKLPVNLTLGGLAVLHAAQRTQDRGGRWGDALIDAGNAAIQLLDLVPDSVLYRLRQQEYQ
ncbi:MAG: hypothetical protein J2P17_26150 [Mycobacterium sp.]|nr:hypothetical protein [Mycobacterium sp.]